MRIAVLSDTHMCEPTPSLVRAYERYMAPADVLVHCGDITEFSVWEYLDQHPDFLAVAGNMCSWSLAGELPRTLDVTLAGFHIGITHGWGSYSTVSHKAVESFGPGFDLVLHGHTHTFAWRTIDGVTVLNPGSFTSPREGVRSMALLDLTPGKPAQVEKIDL